MYKNNVFINTGNFIIILDEYLFWFFDTLNNAIVTSLYFSICIYARVSPEYMLEICEY